MSVVDLADYRPRQLPPEPWGARLARAREEAGFTVRTVEEAINHHFSRGTVNRLEALEAVPASTRDRRRAFLLLVLYGFDPADWDLGPDDVPPLIDLRQLADAGIRTGSR